MKPFITAQKVVEGGTYVKVSLLVPYIRELRDGLNHTLDDLKLPAPADNLGEITVRKAVILWAEVLADEFDNR